MYDLLDRPVGDLPTFERAILMATRRWTQALTVRGAEPIDMVGTTFGDAMSLLHHASEIVLVIRPPCHATVDDSEAVILNLWRLVRDKAFGPAFGIAESLVGDAGTAMVRAIDRAIAFA